jgi:hypothetical protein
LVNYGIGGMLASVTDAGTAPDRSGRVAISDQAEQGGVAQCLKDYASNLSPACGQALNNVGLQ